MSFLASGLLNTARQVGGAVGLAAMATVAAGAASPTAGYDRAFWISAAALAVGATLALLLPRGPKPEQAATSEIDLTVPEGALATSS